VYSPTGDLLFVRQGTLLRQSFDVRRLELTGDPIPVAERMSVNNSLAAFSVSDNGVLTYKTGGSSEVVVLSWLDRTGKLIETVGVPGEYRGVDLSPDGKRLAVHRQDGSGGDIWIFESSRGPMSRLTFDASRDNSSPVWSPDGSYIAFSTAESGKWRMYRKLANGNSNEELLSEQVINTAPMAWFGKLIVVRVVNPRTQGDESVFSFDSRQTTPLLNGAFNELVAQVSPDGKWIAYASNETGANEIYVRPFPSGEGQRQLSASGGYAPRWRKDGKELFFLAGNRFKMASVKINASGSVLNYEPPVELFDTGYINFGHSGGTFLPYAVSPDGQRFLIPRPERPDAAGAGDAATTPITVIVNWAATVKR
jgi:Tol biopolymer transport system component